MLSYIIFAVNRLDAIAKCDEMGVEFESVIWVLNYQLLGDMDTSGYTAVFTDTFKQMPAYEEAARAFGVAP